jgi:hypothetical protein
MKFLDHLEEWLITFLMGAATLIIFVAVVHRYAASAGIPGVQDWLLSLNFSWAQELCIIMFVWMAKFGAAYGVRTGIHVGVDVLINRLEDRMRGKFIIFGLLPARCLPASSARWARTSSGRTERTTHFHVFGHAGRRRSRGSDHARSGVADLDRVFGDSAGQQPDVLPLPAGFGQFRQDRRTAAPRSWPCRWTGR